MAPGTAGNTPPSGPPPSEIQTSPPEVRWITSPVSPAGAIYFQRNDALFLNYFANTAGIQTIVAYRYLTPQGEIKEAQFLPPLTVSTGQTTVQIPFLEGWLLSAAIQKKNSVAAGEWVYVELVIVRGSLPNIQSHGVLWQGYIFQSGVVGFPFSVPQNITDGNGTLRVVIGTAPQAGAEINELVPTFRRWRLLSMFASFTTAVAVANRQTQLLLQLGGTTTYTTAQAAAQAASLVILYTFAPLASAPQNSNGNAWVNFDTSQLLPPTTRIQTKTLNIQAADQWSAPQYLIQEWGQWDL